ncbi:MAG: hypothetical protein M3Q28_05385 [Pseudomonadota bacterium]|nr:hypothetical protein [Pseudomonadota bacterium]
MEQTQVRNRFNRPLSPHQVEELIAKLRQTAVSRQESDPAAADILFKAQHAVTMLWREVALHDTLTSTAEEVLHKAQAGLNACLERESVAIAHEALAELERLHKLIKEPPVTLDVWHDDGLTAIAGSRGPQSER